MRPGPIDEAEVAVQHPHREARGGGPMRNSRRLLAPLSGWWRDAWVPLAVWLAVAVVVGSAAAYSVATEQARVEDDFLFRTEATAEQVAGAVALLQEQMAERATEVLAGEEVSSESLQPVVLGLGFELGVLLDDQGRYITGTRFRPELVGVDVTSQLPHVAQTVREGRPAVSGVILLPGRDVPVVGIAAPYPTPSGQRIIAGGMTLTGGVLDDVLVDDLRLDGVESDVVDADGTVVAIFGGRAPDRQVSFAEYRPAVAAASAETPSGRYLEADGGEHYFSRVEVDGTGWRLVAHGRTSEVFAGVIDLRRTAVVLTASLLGLGLALVVVASRDRRRRREDEETIRRLNRDLEELVEVRTARLREALGHAEEMNEQLQAALGVRDDILAATGHELRTPLTPIIGLLELIGARWDSLDRTTLRDFCDVIARNADRLSALVEALLLATEVRAGTVRATPGPAEARLAVLDAVGRRAETFDVEVVGDDVAVWCQPDHLDQILDVLVANAVTHGAPPYRAEIDSDGARVAIRIIDHGPGAGDAVKEAMFDPFVQGSAGDTRTVTGVGLGLPNARALAEANGGQLTHETSSAGRTIFALLLEAAPTDDRARQDEFAGATTESRQWPSRSDDEAGELQAILGDGRGADLATQIVQTTGAGLLLVDEHGRIRWANATAADMLGDGRSLHGVSVDDLAQGLERGRHASLRTSFASATSIRALSDNDPLPARSLDGRQLYLRIGLAPVGPGDVLVVLDDLTHTVARTRELEQVNHVKDTFLAAISHDLRTPLSNIIGAAETLNAHGTRLTDQQRQRFLDRVQHNASRLQRLLDDLLDVNRVQRGAATVDLQPVQLDSVVEGAVAQIDTAGHGLVIHVDAVTVWLDRTKVERIVENLVANAVRYTPHDARIEVRAEVDDGRIVLEVEDDGPGIPEELRETAFDMFVKGSSETARTSGTGVGLALVREFAQLLGGSAEIGSGTMGGTLVRVTLRQPDATTREHPVGQHHA